MGTICAVAEVEIKKCLNGLVFQVLSHVEGVITRQMVRYILFG
jgi:hypothetical protein